MGINPQLSGEKREKIWRGYRENIGKTGEKHGVIHGENLQTR